MKRVFVIAACTAAAAVAFGTVAPVRVPYALYFKLAPWLGHPSIHRFAVVEHVIVFALLGALIAFAYPNRIIVVCCIIIFGAVLLEGLQTLTPDRHGTIADACQKIVGGSLGVFAAHATIRWRRRKGQWRDPEGRL
jgi:VanZ family protein